MTKRLAVLSVPFLVTVACWFTATPAMPIRTAHGVAQLIGALALTGFALGFVIATRWSLVDRLFGGLDKAYLVHKWLGVASVAAAAIHLITVSNTRGQGMGQGLGPGHGMGHGAGGGEGMVRWAVQLGAPSFVLFLGLGLVALYLRRMPYETWKTVHAFMVVPYVIGLVHYYGSSSYNPRGFTLFSTWMDVLTAVGVAAAIYSVLIYDRVAFRSRYVVSDVRRLASGVVEVTGTALGRPLAPGPGQFAFLKTVGTPYRFPSHPFTVSGLPAPNQVQFAIKNLGDHTASLTSLAKVGDAFAATRPYGRFVQGTRSSRQVWIASGIGVAPFRRLWQAEVPAGIAVDFFYSFRGSDQAPYLTEIEALTSDNITVHRIDTTARPRLDAAEIVAAVGRDTPVDVFFCGPAAMGTALRRGLPRAGLRLAAFHADEFAFGR